MSFFLKIVAHSTEMPLSFEGTLSGATIDIGAGPIPLVNSFSYVVTTGQLITIVSNGDIITRAKVNASILNDDGFCSSIEFGPEFTTVTDMEIFALDQIHMTQVSCIDPLYTANVVNMRGAFYNCNSMTSFALIDTGSVINFKDTWRECSSLVSFPLIDVSSSTYDPLDVDGSGLDMTWRGCSSLTSFPLIDFSTVEYLYETWRGCSSLLSFPSIDTSSCLSMGGAWWGCSSLTSFPLISLVSIDDTTLLVTRVGIMYAWADCSSLTSLPSLDTSTITKFENFISGCSSIPTVPNLDYSGAISLDRAFQDCTSLTEIPNLITPDCRSYNSAFRRCTSLSIISKTDYTLSVGSGVDMEFAWEGCTSIVDFPAISLTSGTNVGSAWLNCSSMVNFNTDLSNVNPDMTASFMNCSSLVDMSHLSLSLTNGGWLFSGCTSLEKVPSVMSISTIAKFIFSGCTSLVVLPDTFDIIPETLEKAFDGCTSLTCISIMDTTNINEAQYGIEARVSIFDNTPALIYPTAEDQALIKAGNYRWVNPSSCIDEKYKLFLTHEPTVGYNSSVEVVVSQDILIASENIVSLAYSGTMVKDVDFTAPNSVAIPAGSYLNSFDIDMILGQTIGETIIVEASAINTIPVESTVTTVDTCSLYISGSSILEYDKANNFTIGSDCAEFDRVIDLSYAGSTITNGVDFNGPTQVTLLAGQYGLNIEVTMISDHFVDKQIDISISGSFTGKTDSISSSLPARIDCLDSGLFYLDLPLSVSDESLEIGTIISYEVSMNQVGMCKINPANTTKEILVSYSGSAVALIVGEPSLLFDINSITNTLSFEIVGAINSETLTIAITNAALDPNPIYNDTILLCKKETGGCYIGTSPILVPDNIDDVLPPGYVADGILEGVTNPDGSIIADEDSLAVTGSCGTEPAPCPVDPDIPCTEYWCLDDGCPPGCQPIPEFPEAPALPTECAIMPHGVAENTTLGGFIDVGDGTDDLIVWSETTGSHAGYIERWDKELSLRQWRIDGETHFPVDNNYHNSIDFPGKVIKLLDGSLLATHKYNVSGGEIDQTRFLLSRYSIVDGGLINYTVPDSSLGSFYHRPEEAASPDEYAYGAVRLFVQKRVIGSEGFSAIYYWNWELNTDSSIIVRPVNYGGNPATCIHTTKNGDIFLGMPDTSITANVSNPGGSVMKFNESNADLTPFLDGERDNPATGYHDYVGYKMWSDDKYFIIFGGASKAVTTIITAYGNYAMYIYDVNTLTFIKKIWDPFSEERVTMNYGGSGFGMGFVKYGNFYYVGMPNDSYKTNQAISKGKTFVYDDNFNFLYEIGQIPILPDGSDSGNTLLVTSDRVYIDIAEFGDWGIHSMKVCKI